MLKDSTMCDQIVFGTKDKKVREAERCEGEPTLTAAVRIRGRS